MKLFKMKLTNGETRQAKGRSVADVLRRMHLTRGMIVFIIPV